MVAQYIVTRPIMDICERSARRLGARMSRQWWEQAGPYLKGAKKGVTDAESERE